MANAICPVTYYVQGVNLKTVASTTIIPVISGKFFHLTKAFVRIVTLSSISVGPSVTITASISGSGAKITAGDALDSGIMAVGAVYQLTLGNGSYAFQADLGTLVAVSVTTGATGTTCTGDVFLQGIVV